jgi:hypothetical protein
MAATDDFSTGDGRATAAVPRAGTDGAGLLHGRRRHFSTGDDRRGHDGDGMAVTLLLHGRVWARGMATMVEASGDGDVGDSGVGDDSG